MRVKAWGLLLGGAIRAVVLCCLLLLGLTCNNPPASPPRYDTARRPEPLRIPRIIAWYL